MRHLSEFSPAEFSCTAADGVNLHGIEIPGAATVGFVLAHGFTHGTAKPATLAVATALAAHGGVVGVDFRGHGRSGGRSSVGRDETLDLDAAVRWARGRGYERVAVVGFSLGAAVAIRHAALGAEPVDATVAVSSPARWYVRESSAMRRVHWLLESPAGPAVGRLLGIRLGEPWHDLPPAPIELVGRARGPVLLVHGTADRYFGTAHAVALDRAGGSRTELWIERGMAHGESGTDRALADRIAGWVVARSAGGARPGPQRSP